MGMDERTQYTPASWPTVTPRIVARDARRLLDFIKAVTDAAAEYRPGAPAVLEIGDSQLTVSDAGDRGPAPRFLYVCVADTGHTYRSAIGAGARPLEVPRDVPYGDRRALIEYEWGDRSQIATHRRARPSPASSP